MRRKSDSIFLQQAREGAANGAGNASAFECGKKAIRYFFSKPVRERQTVPGMRVCLNA